MSRADRFVFYAAEAQSQHEHYRRISALGQDRGLFLNEERLSSAVLRDLVEILPRLESTVAVAPTRLRHTAERLIGRDAELTRLDAAWHDPHQNVVVVRAFGGMGKTSLVATWMAELALKDWRRAERVFDWSFYSQGTREQGGASAETFIAEALRTFGDPDPTLGSPWGRGARLVQLVGKVRCLLVLDGLEPLQHPPGPMAGKLKDPGIEALLKGLAARNTGLCVVTTREKVDDIKRHYGRTADDFPLPPLTDLAGAALLHHSGAVAPARRRSRRTTKNYRPPAGKRAGTASRCNCSGSICAWPRMATFCGATPCAWPRPEQEYQNDASRPYGHAFKAMEAYEKWFASAGEMGQRQLAILKLLGLFDRPASGSCLEALRAAPVIAGLTEPLVGLSPRDWNVGLSRLEEINLLTVNRAASGALDAHPLLREYFAGQLRVQQPDAWRAAHRRLYEHLCATTPDKPQPTLEDLQPLYQAVAHGCQAGLQQEACDKVYRDAHPATPEKTSATKKLGAFGSDLGAVACFFEPTMEPRLTDAYGSRPSMAAFRRRLHLRALGRLTEALEPMRAALKIARQARKLGGCVRPRGQPERTGADAGRGGRGGGGRPAVRDLRRPQLAMRFADERARDQCRRPAPGGPPGRGRGALPRGRADAGRGRARTTHCCIASGLPVLRPAPRRPRTRRVANHFGERTRPVCPFRRPRRKHLRANPALLNRPRPRTNPRGRGLEHARARALPDRILPRRLPASGADASNG